jgi:hypothetical protein
MLLKLFLVAFAAVSMSAGPTPASDSLHSSVKGTTTTKVLHALTRHPRLPLHTGKITPSSNQTAVTPKLSAPLISVYNGLNKVGLTAADNNIFNNGAPPDTTGAIGPNYYVETVNSVIAAYNRSDLSRKGATNFQAWLGKPNNAPVCDPQIEWDDTAQRWLYVVLGCNFKIDLLNFGWSKTADPSNFISGWCRFSVATPNYLSDYPKLGHNANYMIVGTNDFSDVGLHPFLTAEIFWMSLPANGDTSCTPPAVNSTGHTLPLTNGDHISLTATPVPVNTITGSTDGYILSAYDPSGPPASTQSKLAIWHLDAAGVLHQDNDVSVNSYTIPNPAPNPGGSFPIDTLDGRLTQAVGDPVLGMWTQHTVGADTNPSTRSRVDWYEVQVVAGNPQLTQQGTISSSTDFVFNAAVSPTWSFSGAMIQYNRSSGSLKPVIATRTRGAASALGVMDSSELLIGTSADSDHDFSCNFTGNNDPCRWGDYASATPDPNSVNLVWGANQDLAVGSGTNPAWVTRIFAIVVQSRAVLQVPGSSPGSRTGPAQSSPAPTPPSR